MAGGYAATKGGPEGFAARILDLQRQIDQLRLSAGVKSAILRGDLMTWQTLAGADVVQIGSLAFPSTGNTGEGLQVLNHLDGSIIALFYRRDDDGDVRAQFGSDTDLLATFSVNAALTAFDPVGEFRVNAVGDVLFDAGGQFDVDAGNVELNGGGAILQLQADGDAILRGATNSDGLFLGNGVGGVTISSSSETQINSDGNVDIDPTGELRFFIGTTTNPANLNQTSNNVRQVTSGRKYKADIHDADIDPADVLALRPRTWVDKGELERDPAYSQRTVGFIAEELDEHESLRQFVEYDDDGDPNAIYYDRMPAALVALAQAQQVELDALKETVAALVARVEALEADK